MTVVGEFPRSVFAGKLHEGNDDVGVVVDESMVKVCESKKGLNVLNFLHGCGESVRRETETEAHSGGGMELTLLWLGEEIVLSEVLEDFMDMFLMGLEVLGVYQDVIQIDDNTDIKEIHEDAIDKSVESCRSICQAKGHHIPLEGTIPHAERGFPFITFCNADQVVCMAEINLRVDLGLARGIGRSNIRGSG